MDGDDRTGRPNYQEKIRISMAFINFHLHNLHFVKCFAYFQAISFSFSAFSCAVKNYLQETQENQVFPICSEHFRFVYRFLPNLICFKRF